jgi:hypothetical protein
MLTFSALSALSLVVLFSRVAKIACRATLALDPIKACVVK